MRREEMATKALQVFRFQIGLYKLFMRTMLWIATVGTTFIRFRRDRLSKRATALKPRLEAIQLKSDLFVAAVKQEQPSGINLPAIIHEASLIRAESQALMTEYLGLRSKQPRVLVSACSVLLQWLQAFNENKRRRAEDFLELMRNRAENDKFECDLILFFVIRIPEYENAIGDLEEEYTLKESCLGREAALAWYRGQTARECLRLLLRQARLVNGKSALFNMCVNCCSGSRTRRLAHS